jgi:transglutaminase-like putative cysteine protease
MTMQTTDLTADVSAEPFLRATDVIDWTEPNVLGLARSLAAGRQDPIAISRACFEWVRDEIRHCMDYGLDELTCAASEVLRAGTGFCYAKSHLLVALLRANDVPAGLCYQRLARDEAGTSFVVHGLAAVRLPALGWYRVDPRGNKPGVNAQFTPPIEQLAFATG